jgi:ArsR family transcriptional regulator
MQKSAYYQRTNLIELTNLFKALSDETRLRVLNLLLERECCVCEVMQSLDISQSKASRTLKALYEVGILKLRRNGTWSLYSVEKESMRGYLRGMVKAIAEALAESKQVKSDRERLKRAERIGPGAAEKLRQGKDRA